MEDANSNLIGNDGVWIGVMVGIAVFITAGLWLGSSSSELIDDKPAIVTIQPEFKHEADKITSTSEVKEDQSNALASVKSSQESSSEKIFGFAEKEINELRQQQKQSAEEMPLATKTADKQPEENKLIAKSSSIPEKTSNSVAIKDNLIAAEKAMSAERFTTPLKDNANKYYQNILAMDPDNADALAGLQKIVDIYVQYIEKARSEGKLKTAKLYLERAESVLPNDLNLLSIRAELAATKE